MSSKGGGEVTYKGALTIHADGSFEFSKEATIKFKNKIIKKYNKAIAKYNRDHPGANLTYMTEYEQTDLPDVSTKETPNDQNQ